MVAAPFGMTLGGGPELRCGADAVQAAAEIYMGLVEVGVGLIPGGGGMLAAVARARSRARRTRSTRYAFVKQMFMNIGARKVATSAEEAKALGFFRATDGVVARPRPPVDDAKQRALGLARRAATTRRAPRTYQLPGESGTATLHMMLYDMQVNDQIAEHDADIGQKLANVLCGGDGSAVDARVTEEHVLELEREAFLSLCGEPKTQERMQYMLQNNKPLRN